MQILDPRKNKNFNRPINHKIRQISLSVQEKNLNLLFKCHLCLAHKSKERKVSCHSCYLKKGHNLALERLSFLEQIYLGVGVRKSLNTHETWRECIWTCFTLFEIKFSVSHDLIFQTPSICDVIITRNGKENGFSYQKLNFLITCLKILHYCTSKCFTFLSIKIIPTHGLILMTSALCDIIIVLKLPIIGFNYKIFASCRSSKSNET